MVCLQYRPAAFLLTLTSEQNGEWVNQCVDMLSGCLFCYCCRDDTTKMTGHFDGYVEVPSKDESAVMEALMKHGPLAVGVDATFDEFLFHRWAPLWFENAPLRLEIGLGVGWGWRLAVWLCLEVISITGGTSCRWYIYSTCLNLRRYNLTLAWRPALPLPQHTLQHAGTHRRKTASRQGARQNLSSVIPLQSASVSRLLFWTQLT
jgi:hypothetical protein